MASLVPGYEYDIFISYRQKDNKHDGWVTKFVENLKGELESTFKEDISIYFDENPHDRLQETYNVSKSLEGKLRCLIFIPILSQTYCDPASYAWQFEFIAFIRLTDADRFGKDVKVKSGNVASRILPIRIHDLDPEDVKLFEKETGTVLRAIDFVFKTSAGVNRPLIANEDHPNDNLNKTFYRDQINKTANAIKEIILGLKSRSSDTVTEVSAQNKNSNDLKNKDKNEKVEKSVKSKKSGLLSVTIIASVIIITLAIIFSRLFPFGKIKVARDQDGRISIAVNNFTNNTNDTTLNWLEEGIPELLRNNLGGNEELSVQNTQTMNELYEIIKQTQNASVISSLPREAAIRLKTSTYITGSFQKYGNNILTLAKLIDTKSGELLWTGQTEGNLDRIKILTDSLSFKLKNFLEIEALKQKATPEYGEALTYSSDAYRKYIIGIQSLINMDQKSALSYFHEAYHIDPTFILASFYIANTYDAIAAFTVSSQNRRHAALWVRKTYSDKEKLPENYRLWLEMWYAYYITKNTEEVLKYCKLLEQSDIQSRYFWNDIAETYMIFGKLDDALKIYEKIKKTSSDWGEDWKYLHYYYQYANCYHQLGMHDKEAEIYQTGLRLSPGNTDLMFLQARCAVSTGDTAAAAILINKYIKIKNLAATDGYSQKAYFYEQAGAPDKAETLFRQALKMDANNNYRYYRLGIFLVNSGRNVDEGMDLLNKLQKKYPGVWNNDFFYNKSIGLVKQGKFTEADSLVKILTDSTWTASIEIDNLKKAVRDSLSRKN
jgi:tetratricopeptide (TPR) repeat protein